jgi:hypothetical protein
VGHGGTTEAARREGAAQEREAILNIVQEAAWKCRQMTPRQEDEGVARLRALAEVRQGILNRADASKGS